MQKEERQNLSRPRSRHWQPVSDLNRKSTHAKAALLRSKDNVCKAGRHNRL